MKTKIIFLLVALFSLGACKEENAVMPSYADRDWLKIEDDPNDEITHLRYLIYQETGVSVYYNDTLGTEVRYDALGNPYTHYELIRLGYNITSNAFGRRYTLADNKEDVKAMLEFIRDYLFDYLPAGKRPRSYLLVDSLIASNTTIDCVYQGLSATCIGEIEKVKNMTEQEKKRFAGEISGYKLVSIREDEINEELFMSFDSITTQVKLSSDYQPTKVSYEWSFPLSPTKKTPDPEMFALLKYKQELTPGIIKTPWKTEDAVWFIGLILSTPEADIREKYKDYPLIIRKYELIRKAMVNSGLLEGEAGEE